MVRSAGAAVKPGDNLFEIETDKVSMEVPSTTDRRIGRNPRRGGRSSAVGAVVAVIADGFRCRGSPGNETGRGASAESGATGGSARGRGTGR